MKKCFSLLLIAFLLIGVFGCSQNKKENSREVGQLTVYEDKKEAPREGGTLRLALAGAQSLNPLLATNQNNLWVLGLVFDGLFTRTAEDRVEPVLCKDYTVSADGLRYEFILKDGVSFHSGARLTAHDVVRTLEHLMASEGVFKGRFSDIASFEANGMTLVINLHKPVINFIALLDFPVLSERDLGSIGQGFSLASGYVPNGTGRYKVQSYKKSKELYLSVNQNYHRPFNPYIKDILVYILQDRETAVSMLENLQIDALPSDIVNVHAYTPKRSLSSVEFTEGQFTFLGLNNQKTALLSAATRIALAVSVDKPSLVSNASLQYAKPVDLPLPRHSFWNDSALSDVSYDTGYAKSLLAEDGWQDTDEDGILDKMIYGEKTDLRLEILVNEENQTRIKLAELLRGYLQAAGVSVYVAAVPFAEYEARIAARNYDLFVGSVSLSGNYDLSFLFKTDENFCGISISEADSLLYALSVNKEEAQKQMLFHDLCGVIKQQMPIVGLYFEYDMLIFDDRIKGDIRPSSSDVFHGIEHWFLAE